MTMQKIDTKTAIALLRNLSPATARSDQVMVECRSQAENNEVEALAKAALARGYVRRITVADRTGELGVHIKFGEPQLP